MDVSNNNFDKSLMVRCPTCSYPEIPLPRKYNEKLPELPCCMLLSAVVKSGKSVILNNFFLSKNFWGGKEKERIFDQIYLICPTAKIDRSYANFNKEVYEDYVIIHDDPHTAESFITNILEYQGGEEFDIKDEDRQPPRIAIILDDMNGIVNKNSRVITELVSRYRHYNVQCLVYATQALRTAPSIWRNMATAVILSKCHNDLEKIKILEEWNGEYDNRLMKAWDDITQEQYEFCYLKMDEYKRRMFQIGKYGVKEVDFKKYPKTSYSGKLIKEK
jgi:hypothetical protein